MKRKLSLLLLAALATLALCAPLSLAQEEEPVTLTWFQTLDAKASASMQSMDESPTWQLIQEKLNIDTISMLYGSIPRPGRNGSNST